MTLCTAARLVVGLSATAATLLALTSCSSGSSSTQTGSSSVSTNALSSSAAGQVATSPAAASTAAAGAAHPIDVCATVTAAKASQLSAQPITEAHPESGLQDLEYGCGYSNDDSSVQVQLTVFEHDAKSSYDLFSSQSKNVTQVPSLGDKAFYDNDETMYVLAGNNLIQVNGVDGADHCAALARPLLAAL